MKQPLCATFGLPDDPAARLNTFTQFCSSTIAAAVDTTRAMSLILEFIAAATGAVGASIAMPEAGSLVVSAATRNARHRRGERIPMNSGVFGAAFSNRDTYVSNSTIDPRADASRSYARIGTTIVSPIKHGRRAYGVLIATYPAAYGIHSVEARDVRDFTSVAGEVLGYAIYERENARTGSTPVDPQTGLELRRGYERELKAQYDLYKKFAVPFSLALFDLSDHPQSVAAGGDALRRAMRGTDNGFRLDGVLAVLLKNCSETDAETALSRLDRALPVRVPMIVAAPRFGESLRDFRGRAERSLLQAKTAATPWRAASTRTPAIA